jgi:hypothetical protein
VSEERRGWSGKIRRLKEVRGSKRRKKRVVMFS